MIKQALPYDVYERHRKVAEFIENNQTILDVGGELNHLSGFLKAKKLTVANLNTGDVIISKTRFPFRQDSYEIVTAIDVLEHIPKVDRKEFIAKLIKVAKKKVILSFPLGTTKHEAYEKKIYEKLKTKGINVLYLNEHIKYGLPNKEDVQKLIQNKKFIMTYSGNININEGLFSFYLFDPKIKFIRKIIYIIKQLLYIITNPIFYKILTGEKFKDTVNRAYLIIYK